MVHLKIISSDEEELLNMHTVSNCCCVHAENFVQKCDLHSTHLHRYQIYFQPLGIVREVSWELQVHS